MLDSPYACWLFQQKLGFPLACFHSLSPQAAPRGSRDLVSVNSRSVPKFMKRMKVPDYKDKTVFGVPLIVHVQRTGQPLPQSIQQALRYLRSNCLDQVWLYITNTDPDLWNARPSPIPPVSDKMCLTKKKRHCDLYMSAFNLTELHPCQAI